MKEQLTDAQKGAIQAIGLSVEGIAKVEDATGWRFAQHTTNGSDIRFIVRKITGEYELVIWLKKKITVGVYVTRDKRRWQEVFSKKLGAWSPDGMDTEGYAKKGNSEIRGHIGDWKTNFNANEFMKNLEAIKVMVQSITGKLDETGISENLANGKPLVNLGDIEDDDDYVNDDAAEEGKCLMSRNLIVFGAPGTGKSYQLNRQTQREFEDIDDDGNVRHKRYERVTFYPTYSYAQFVGTYKPVMKPKANGAPGEEEIAYEFVPGPFLRVLMNALNEAPDADNKNKKKEWCLVIEEINRANAAAVFGDVFQLLDRGSDGVSEYSVAASEDVKKYLLKGVKTETGKTFLKMAKRKDSLGNETEEWDCILRIPSNMYIWATMNSADQGVFPMDTAFKRRWAFEYLGLDKGVGEDGEDNWMIGTKDNKFTYRWEDFRRYVNRLLALAKVNEDKLMGPFFMKKPANGIIDKDEFESKVLMYIWEDAGKMCRRQLFGDISTYSELIDEWEEKGIEIFSSALRDKDTIKDKGNNLRNAKTLFSKKLKPDGQGEN